MNKFALFALVASPLALLGNLSHAAAVDVTAAVTDIGAQATPVGLVGVAILGVVVAVAAFGWIRKGVH